MSERRGGPWTIRRVLTWTVEKFIAEGMESPRLDAEVLLAHCLDLDRIQIYTDHDRPLGQAELKAYHQVVRRRLQREPVAYITGHREFWSLSFAVDPSVLVPRPETELLVERAAACCSPEAPPPTVVDVGTGSGAVALALCQELPSGRFWATDTSAGALDVARGNAAAHQREVTFLKGDLLSTLPPDIRANVVVSNPPYIPTGELAGLPRDVRDWEPMTALDGGEDGLDVIRALVPQAVQRLVPGGYLLLEISGPAQSDAVMALMAQHGLQQVEVAQDLSGLDRVVWGRRAGEPG